MDEWAANERERLALADDLSGIPDTAWNAQSLCAEWKVRDVVGHLVSGATIRRREWLGGFVKNGFNFNRFVGRDAIVQGRAEPAALLGVLVATASSRNLPPGARPLGMLGDTICHGQDIRRPLGLDHHLPNESLGAVADWFKGTGFPFGTKKRIAGIRLVATDAQWATGEGPEAAGPLEALVMVMAGRQAALADLTGPATATIEGRFPNDPA
jgi:uncharacterized protein (TIGR03083 family)